ncbi:hypothetical protein HmCmsJML007_03622 [Escherichia coli]|nr:hypothetical protein HmCmsJML007_03622 [Escherichia coli]
MTVSVDKGGADCPVPSVAVQGLAYGLFHRDASATEAKRAMVHGDDMSAHQQANGVQVDVV